MALRRQWLSAAVVGLTVILALALGVAIANRFAGPLPPRRLVISTGREDGAYYLYALEYQRVLARQGFTLDIQPGSGSIATLKRLAAGAVDAGFVQGGTAPGDLEEVTALGSLFYEPLWIFHRQSATVSYLSDPRGRRLAIGEENSGTRELTLRLLADNEVTDGNTQRPGQFPSEVGLDLPLNEQARRYLRTGPSWLERTVPFRLAGILDRSILVLLPVVTLMFPLFGLVLPLLDRRHRRRIARRYERLRDSCLRGASSSPDAVKAEIEYLRALRREVLEDTDVPPMYFGEVFHLTMHIDQVLEQQERRLTHSRETLLSHLSSDSDSR